LACQYGRYGYRRITALLQLAGWFVGKDRVQRIWRREGLKVPAKQKPRGRLWLNDGSCIRLRPDLCSYIHFVCRRVPAHGGAVNPQRKASLWPHKKHLERVESQKTPISGDDGGKAAQGADTRVPVPRPPAAIERNLAPGAALSQAARELVEERNEFIWNEAVQGMADAKRLGAIGSQVGFLRVTQTRTEFLTRLNGLLDGPQHVTVNQVAVIMMPKATDLEPEPETRPATDIKQISETE
jgi:hypothetical protein